MRVVTLVAAGVIACTGRGNAESAWQKDFGLSERALGPTGRNEYFILEPGFQLVLEKPNEKLVITVLEETKEVTGIATRVVEEREWKRGKLVEVSRNFFAICEKTRDVFYFGEDVDMYRRGKITSHKGEWVAGKKNAKAGLMMSGKPRVGMTYYQEIAPGVAMDRAKVVQLDETLETPAGSFSNCLRTREGTALNFFEREYKTYAPGIGLIQDQKLLLTSYGFVGD
jgi:hypothetical protein